MISVNIKHILTVIAGLALVATAGCARPAEEVSAELGQEFTLAPGQTASIAGEGLKIRFIEVISDSRCPQGVTCIWQGEVSCLVAISYAGSMESKVLTQPGLTAGSAATDFAQYELQFTVNPYPKAGERIKDEDYRLQLVVNQKPSLTGGVLVTFDVAGETYSVFITNQATIEQVYAVQRGESKATIPSGRLLRGQVPYNKPWSWHIDSEDIHMAEATVELCDGTPSQVEANLDYWVNTVQRFCPWSARIVEIQDFR